MNYMYFFFYWFWIIMMFFMFFKNPLIMSLMLIMNTFFLCIFIMLYSYSSWNSYILFLMFLGGVLILFLYNVSLISNEMFYFKKINKFLLISFFIFNLKTSFLNDMTMFFWMKELSPTMCFFFMYNFNSIIFLMIYLFFSLICVVNLIYSMNSKGSLRMKL